MTDSVTSFDVCLETSNVSTNSTLSRSEPFVSFNNLIQQKIYSFENKFYNKHQKLLENLIF
jgi:hypothetical protein